MASFITMHTHSLNSVIFSTSTPQNILINQLWFDGYGNVYAILEFPVIIVVLLLLYLPLKQKYIRGLAIFPLSIFVSIVAEWFWLTKNFSYGTIGQSGIVYALFGVIISIGFVDIIFMYMKKQYDIMIIDIIVALGMMLIAIFNFEGFFFVSPDVNYFVHECSFLFGLIAGSAFAIAEGILTLKDKQIYESMNAFHSVKHDGIKEVD